MKPQECECQRCGHKWILRIPNPHWCPKCNSPYWNKARIRIRKGNIDGSNN